jgi:hypothetical protein
MFASVGSKSYARDCVGNGVRSVLRCLVCFVPKRGVLFQFVPFAWNNIKSGYVLVFISLFIFIFILFHLFLLFQHLYYEGQIYIGD